MSNLGQIFVQVFQEKRENSNPNQANFKNISQLHHVGRIIYGF